MAIDNKFMLYCLVASFVCNNGFFMFLILMKYYCPHLLKGPIRYSLIGRMPKQIEFLRSLVTDNDINCFDNLRMDRRCFWLLCRLLKQSGGLRPSKYVSVNEKVAMFLVILAHHTKNRITRFHFKRSGDTVSKCFNEVLTCVVSLHEEFLVQPTPVDDECEDYAWKPFEDCIGALDGTYIHMIVPAALKPRFRSRKGDISSNVLGVCDRNSLFTYVLAGWGGSAADGRVLKDAIFRPNGLRIPKGNYYLGDGGYTNAEGILTPFLH